MTATQKAKPGRRDYRRMDNIQRHHDELVSSLMLDVIDNDAEALEVICAAISLPNRDRFGARIDL